MTALVVARIGPHRLGAPVDAVSELVQLGPLAPVPGVGAPIVGMTVLRGQPQLVVALHDALGAAWPPRPQALRWAAAGQSLLVAVDAIEALWTPPDPALPRDTWERLVPPALRGTLAAAFRDAAGWVWAWTPDFPIQWLNTEGIAL